MEHVLMRKTEEDMITFHFDGKVLYIQTSEGDPEEFHRISLSFKDTVRLKDFLMIELMEEV